MHPIKRAALVLVLSLGAIGGFTHGFAGMAQCHRGGGCSAESRRDQFEEHVADVCTRAAQRVYDENDRDQAPPSAYRGGWGNPQWGGPPPSWGGPPPQYWGAPPAPAAASPVAPVAPAAVIPSAAPTAPAAE